MKTVNELIEYLQNIPDNTWTVNIVDNFVGGHCVLGHINKYINANGSAQYTWKDDYTEGPRNKVFLSEMGVDYKVLADVNNGYGNYSAILDEEISSYGKTPKERVLNYLKQHHDTRTSGAAV